MTTLIVCRDKISDEGLYFGNTHPDNLEERTIIDIDEFDKNAAILIEIQTHKGLMEKCH